MDVLQPRREVDSQTLPLCFSPPVLTGTLGSEGGGIGWLSLSAEPSEAEPALSQEYGWILT